MRRNIKRVAAVGLPLSVVAVAGIAFAAWTSSGSGVGSAAAGTPQDVVFKTASTSATDVLYPTGAGELAATVDNPNAYKVGLYGFGLTAAYDAATYSVETPGTNLLTTCALSLSSALTTSTLSTPNATIAAGNNKALNLADAVQMGNAADEDACAGKTFVLAITSSAVSSD